jgi:hypothetical protein
LLKGAAGGLLGLAMLGWVAEQSGARDAEVVVHVLESDVEVILDHQAYRVDRWPADPIVCRLPPGRYQLVMRRSRRTLFEESFEVQAGEHVMRLAYPATGAVSVGPRPTSPPWPEARPSATPMTHVERPGAAFPRPGPQPATQSSPSVTREGQGHLLRKRRNDPDHGDTTRCGGPFSRDP